MGSALNARWGSPYPFTGTAVLTYTDTTLSAQDSKVGFILPFSCSGTSETLTHVGFRYGAFTGTPASNSYKASIQGVDASGNPDGTVLGGGSPASLTYTPAGADANGWIWKTLANGISVNRGTRIAGVIERVAATDGSNCLAVSSAHGRIINRSGISYGLTYSGGSWTKTTGTGNHHCMAVKSASGVYGFPADELYSVLSLGSTTERGLFFTMPTNFCSTYKVKAIRILGTTPSGGSGTHQATLYSSPVTGSIAILNDSGTIDNDSLSVGGSQDREMLFVFTGTLATLNAGTEYGIGLATTTGSDMGIVCIDVESVGDLDAYPYGQQLGYMTRTLTDYPPSGNDSNNFTKTTTRRPVAELILDDITAPSGGGSTTIRGGAMFCG